jgi:hypothetical protein
MKHNPTDTLRFPLFLAFFFIDLTASTHDVDFFNRQRR